MFVRVMRYDAVTGEQKPGPWHLESPSITTQSRCGRRMKGIGVQRDDTAAPGEKTCRDCQRLALEGKVRSWRG